MTMDRQFLGWNESCLHLAAAWLREKYEHNDQLDLSQVLIALPGARSGRRLLELLAADRGLIGSPRIVTVGHLPEHLYQPSQPLADSLASLLARWHALRTVDREALENFVPQPPDEADFAGWLGLAREMNHLDDELAAELYTFASVAKRDFDAQDLPEDDRWATLHAIGEQYQQCLASLGMLDRNAARIDAVAGKLCAADCDVVVIGTIDMNRVVRDMLSQVADRVSILIHAPESETANFDDWGCAIVEANEHGEHGWLNRAIPIDDAKIHVVDSAAEQALEVARVIEQHAAQGNVVDPTCITVGLGDESLSPAIERVLQHAGLPTHSAVGTPMSRSRPAMLLAAVAAFADRLRLDDFASLLRHCDIERFLRQNLATQQNDHADADHTSATIHNWLTLLDDYISDHLHVQPVSDWLGKAEDTEPLVRVYDAVRTLLPESPDLRRPLPAWSETLADLLRTIYGDLSLDDNDPQSRQLGDALKAIAELLRQQAAWASIADHGNSEATSSITPLVSFADAVRFTLSRLGDQAIPDAAGDGVELLGWLELQLDDADQLIVTGFNERNIPASTHGDALLPNQMRQALGMMHNDRRTARDAAALTAMLHSRPHVTLIAGRRGSDGEPLMPSRLLLRCSADALPARVQRFYPKDRPLTVMPIAWPCAAANQLLVPAPMPPSKPITELYVTAFRNYLDCPYRFYLKHILKLKTVDDAAAELNAAQFGNIMHAVLDAFGKRGPAHSAKEDEVFAFLDQQLDVCAAESFGDDPVPTVRIQIEQMRHRLSTFARWQVAEVDAGWRMVPAHTEKRLKAELDVDGETIHIVGRIDRIDRHNDDKQQYRVLDYKTGDAAKWPLSAHCKGVRKRKPADGDVPRDIGWVDLQLPLYRLLVAQLKIESPTLGYVRLCKDPRAELLAEADWIDAEYVDAIEKARDVVRQIRAGNFWPPREPGQYDDEFSDLCLERHLGREHVLTQSAAAHAAGSKDGGAK